MPSPAGALPTLPTGALPAAIEVPTAIKEPVKVTRRPRKPKVPTAPTLAPVFVNQIQISSE